jgi:hypothetical protein
MIFRDALTIAFSSTEKIALLDKDVSKSSKNSRNYIFNSTLSSTWKIFLSTLL